MWEEQAADPQLCVFCNKTTADPKICPRCKVHYCSEECSYADRHLHQFLCTPRDVYRSGNEKRFRIAVENAVLYTPDLMDKMGPSTSDNGAEVSCKQDLPSGHALLQPGRKTNTADPTNEDVAGSQSTGRGSLPDNLISLPKEELVKRIIEQIELLEQSERHRERLRRELEVTRAQAQKYAMEASIIRKEHASCGSGEKEKLLEEKARVLGESLAMALQALHVAQGCTETLEHEEADREGKSAVARNKIPTSKNSMFTGSPVTTSVMKTSTPVMAVTPVTSSVRTTSTPVMAVTPVTSTVRTTSTPVMAVTPVTSFTRKPSTPVMAVTPVTPSVTTTSTPVMVVTPVTASVTTISTPVMVVTPVTSPVTKTSTPVMDVTPVTASPVKTSTRVIAGTPTPASPVKTSTRGMAGTPVTTSVKTSTPVMAGTPVATSVKTSTRVKAATPAPASAADTPVTTSPVMATSTPIMTDTHRTPPVKICSSSGISSAVSQASSVCTATQPGAAKSPANDVIAGPLATATSSEQGLPSKLPVDDDSTEHASPIPVRLGTDPEALMEDLFNKHQGHMYFICRKCCYEMKPCRISSKHAQKESCDYGHPWYDHGNLLVYQQEPQGQIEPIQQRPFTHSNSFFRMCYSKKLCPRVGFNGGCKFAHSAIECEVWCMERDTGWSQKQIQLEYCRLASHRNIAGKLPVDGDSTEHASPIPARLGRTSEVLVEDLFNKHQGHMYYICRKCYYEMKPCRISSKHAQKGSCDYGHPWYDHGNLLVYQQEPQGQIEPIQQRPFTQSNSFFRMCYSKKLCPRVGFNGGCKFAHSAIECEVWCMERDTGWSQKQIQLEYCRLASQRDIAAKLPVDGDITEHASPIPFRLRRIPKDLVEDLFNKHQEHSYFICRKCYYEIIEQANSIPVRLRRTPADLVENLFNKHQGHMYFICRKCYYELKPCRITSKHAQKESCVYGHPWYDYGNLLVYRQEPQGQIDPIQQRPFTQRNSFFRMCYSKKFCPRVGFNAGCKFAHSAIECEVWCMERDTGWSQKQIQLEYCRLASQRDIAEASSCGTPTTENAPNPAEGQLAVSASFSTSPITSNAGASPYYCQYCNVQCNSERQLQHHTTSDKHKVNIFFDNDHQWNHRPPPWGWHLQAMQLCDSQRRGTCLFGDKDGVFNHCPYAHSQEELDEWRERVDWRQMKQAMAKEQHLLSYMDDILDEYQSAAQPTAVMSEDTTDALIDCSTPLRAYSDQKQAKFSWEFTVTHKADFALKMVALLHNYDRAHFSLQGRNLPHRCQHVQGDQLLAPSDPKTYRVKITFFANLFGSFNQSVVFDFGTRPITRRRLHIDVGTASDQDKVDKLRKKLHMDMWTPANRTFVYFNEEHKEKTKRSFVNKLLSKYPVPTTDEVVNLQLDGELNRYNYVRKMHQLLQLEELSQSAIIGRTFSQATIRILDKITEDGLVLPHPGELFAVVPLEEHLSDETEAGQLILNKTRSVLLGYPSNASKRVYEAFIVNRDVFDYEGKRGDCIYLVLSPRCCKDMRLKAGDRVSVVLQFQLDRETLCYMHYALDKLEDTMHVFPDFSKTDHLPACSIPLSTNKLNGNQMRIVEHVMSQGSGYNPPLLVYGPFGTGKTETIAQASILLLTSKPNARILICTHSNRAADLYITRYFHKFIASQQERKPKMLRMYYEGRRFATVDATVLGYCRTDEDMHAFSIPGEETLKKFDLVIATVMTSVQLTRLGMRGHFTHIFIDEAGQALECETLIPFTLANENTCIVLAGDHQQMSPTVYSPEARTLNFHHSILQRLFYYYNSLPDCDQKSRLLTIMLVDNYRTKEEILRFISSVYYGGPESLKCRSEQPDVAHIRPMYFYVARGEEALDAGSASYYNMAEVQEVADRVVEIFDHWRDEWGERKAEAIAVVAQYHAQVMQIRNKLRSLRRPELKRIEVHRMQNLQGCEFRVLCISTVRTCHLIQDDGCFTNSGRGYGFLSDSKLLNTALTRSQNAILVVGDPVAVCSIGKCRGVWRSYLRHCQELGTIYPPDITFETVQMQVDDLTSTASPDGRNINDHCDETSVFDENA